MAGRAHRAPPATDWKRNSIMSNSVKIVAILAAKPGKAAALRALLDGMLAPSRAEPGNLRYDLWQDQAEPTRFVLDELYADADAVASHRETPHFRDYLSKINDLADRTALVLAPLAIA
jgi:quinol monooxygenase YgiN